MQRTAYIWEGEQTMQTISSAKTCVYWGSRADDADDLFCRKTRTPEKESRRCRRSVLQKNTQIWEGEQTIQAIQTMSFAEKRAHLGRRVDDGDDPFCRNAPTFRKESR